ncbi:hypothetical protein ATANTOWER_022270 [Ataeniobius toweri]|uniref:Uncharacterized protein n=1 Tax=Ataeniobius toweri TaxID=208326 RepID=A0ABU7ABW0_9TELE|nr:hypothetical protein [Ataeniobius toweri]
MSTVLDVVCSVALMDGGWGAVVAHCVVEGGVWQGCLERYCMWSLRCVVVSSLAFQGWSSSVRAWPCGEGIHGIWVWGHVFDICVLVKGGPVRKFMLGFIGVGDSCG